MSDERRIGAQGVGGRPLGRPSGPTDIGRPWTLAELPAPPLNEPRSGPSPMSATGRCGGDELAALRDAMLVDRARAVDEALQRGRAEGREAGEAAAMAQLRSALEVAGGAARDIAEQERRFVGTLEDNMVALATAIARLVIGRELSLEPGLVVELTRQALSAFPTDQPLRVRVNPAQHRLLSATCTDGARELTWLADPHVVPGGFLIEGRERLVDGRVDTALERVYRQLAGNE